MTIGPQWLQSQFSYSGFTMYTGVCNYILKRGGDEIIIETITSIACCVIGHAAAMVTCVLCLMTKELHVAMSYSCFSYNNIKTTLKQ